MSAMSPLHQTRFEAALRDARRILRWETAHVIRSARLLSPFDPFIVEALIEAESARARPRQRLLRTLKSVQMIPPPSPENPDSAHELLNRLHSIPQEKRGDVLFRIILYYQTLTRYRESGEPLAEVQQRQATAEAIGTALHQALRCCNA